MRLIYLGLFAAVFLTRNAAYTFARSPNISSIFEQLMQGYDSNVRPNFGGPPLEVQASVYVLDIYSISEKYNEFTMEMYFRQHWEDLRLIFKAPMGIKYIPVDAKLMNNIWKPDTFFINTRHSSYHTPTNTNSFLRLHPNGEIAYSQKVTVTASCIMSVRNYPFDTQMCSLDIESYGYNAADIVYSWKSGNNSVGASPEIAMTRFRLLGYTNTLKEAILSTGNYTRLGVNMFFKRISSFFIINVYIPAILLVIISCFSFLLTSTSTRIIINGLTLFMLLAMTTIHCSIILSVKAIDVFMLFSMVTNVLVLVYHMVSAKFEKPEEAKKDAESGAEKLSIRAAFDKYTKIVIPIIYLLGNIIYWTCYGIATSLDLSGIIPVLQI